MESAAPSPFLEAPEAEWVCANDLCFAIFDSFPVSPGHVLVITRYTNVMGDPRGGVRHVILEKGNYLAGPAAPAAEKGAPHRLPGPRYTTHVPVYDLTAAAGFWGPESVPEEIGWTELPGVSLKDGMFVARVTGTSMEPLIPDGSWCLFRPCRPGSREGRIVLVQLGTDGAGENGGRFTVKKYHSEKTVTADGWRHTSLQLLPLNPAFEPIEIEPEAAADVVIAGEFAVLIPQP